MVKKLSLKLFIVNNIGRSWGGQELTQGGGGGQCPSPPPKCNPGKGSFDVLSIGACMYINVISLVKILLYAYCIIFCTCFRSADGSVTRLKGLRQNPRARLKGMILQSYQFIYWMMNAKSLSSLCRSSP